MGGPPPHRLHDGPTPWMAPKARALSILADAGLPVPPGVVVQASARAPLPLDELLARGPVAVRSAAQGEDTETHSAAGLHTSVLGLQTEAEVFDALDTVLASPGVDQAVDQAVVQAQVRGRWLVVAASTELGTEVEVHALDATLTAAAQAELLAGASTPTYCGRLQDWDAPTSARVDETVRAAIAAGLAAGLSSRHGWDLELVVDDAAVWIVQLRPLASPLHPGWPAFADAVADSQGRDAPSFPAHRLTLDAEHNPAPLSVAHAWVMEQLAEDRGKAAGAPLVVAGWLYVATLPRDLSRPRSTASVLSPHAALALLHGTLLPQARARLTAIDEALSRPASAATIRDALDHAWAAFLTMIDQYVGTLVPARRAAGTDAAPVDATDPLTLRERDRYLDVLPATWDIASPTLAELGARLRENRLSSSDRDVQLPTDSARARTLLSEWDDHLFALGLAPLRRVYLRVAQATGLGDDVFLLRGPELAPAIDGARPDLDRRRMAQQRFQRLAPPSAIDHGQPVAVVGRGRGFGIGIGPAYRGVAAVRRDLPALLSNPPAPGAVVMLPALTAPAAVAVHAAGVTAVCCEFGGPLSHAALMARELELSALVGCRGCTDVVDGTTVRLDTRAGRLIIEPSSVRSLAVGRSD